MAGIGVQMKRVSLVQIGVGTVGSVLAEQVIHGHDRWTAELGLDIRITALAGRSGAIVASDPNRGFGHDELAHILAHRSDPASSRDRVSLDDVVGQMASSGTTIVIDAAAGKQTAPVLARAVEQGAGAVLSNKAPLALPMADPVSQTLWNAAQREQLRYEATCGAGLPVISTLQGLLDAGDRVLEVTGCLSGTLGAIFSMVAAGEAFSAAVRDARARGYTEPDPRDDLSGLDVARKALILARTMGITIDLADVSVQSLIPADLSDVSVEAFLAGIDEEDNEIATLAKRAKQDQASLKYVARIDPSAATVATVGLSEVSTTTMLGALQGPENIISFRTERYHTYQLVVAGPGAGAAVTAAGMVNDMLHLAQRLR
jgi:homoserine dehydrogenase